MTKKVRHPDYHRSWKYKTKYGITLDDYDKMLLAQQGKCAICKTDEPGGSGERFSVDHNHGTSEVRGLLCCNCNRGIGYLKDSPDIVAAALLYLSTNGYYGT